VPVSCFVASGFFPSLNHLRIFAMRSAIGRVYAVSPIVSPDPPRGRETVARRIEIEGDELVVRLDGWDTVAAVKRELRVPLGSGQASAEKGRRRAAA